MCTCYYDNGKLKNRDTAKHFGKKKRENANSERK